MLLFFEDNKLQFREAILFTSLTKNQPFLEILLVEGSQNKGMLGEEKC